METLSKIFAVSLLGLSALTAMPVISTSGTARADDGYLGFFWGKFVNGDRFTRGSEVDHPFGHAEFDGALDIFEDKLGFDGDG